MIALVKCCFFQIINSIFSEARHCLRSRCSERRRQKRWQEQRWQKCSVAWLGELSRLISYLYRFEQSEISKQLFQDQIDRGEQYVMESEKLEAFTQDAKNLVDRILDHRKLAPRQRLARSEDLMDLGVKIDRLYKLFHSGSGNSPTEIDAIVQKLLRGFERLQSELRR